MPSILRTWKCRNCGRANSTEIGLEGTGTCTYCSSATQVQPSRIRNGVVLPASFPTRPPGGGGRLGVPAEGRVGVSESRSRR